MNNIMVKDIFLDCKIEYLVLDDKVLFNPRQVGEILSLTNSSVRDAISKMNSNQVVKLKNSDVEDIDFRKLNNAGENFITESGLYKLVMRSNKKEAIEFQDFITDELLPSLRKYNNFGILEMFSKDTQKELMDNIKENAETDKKIYTLANRFVNAIVSDKWGFEKPLKKDEMIQYSNEMILDRQKILEEWVNAYKVGESKSLANHIIRKKYNLKQVGKYKKIK